MFGNFNLNAGFSQLQDLGGKFQKIREDLEQNIESSLRSNVAPTTGSGGAGASTSVDGSVSFAEWEGYSLSDANTNPAEHEPTETKREGYESATDQTLVASDASEAVPQQPDSGTTDTNQHDVDQAQQALHTPSQHSNQEELEQQEPSTSPQLEIVSEHALPSELKQHQAAVDTVNTDDAVEHASQVSHEPALQPQQQEQLTASSDTESTAGSVIITDTEAVAQILAAVDSGTEEPELEQTQAEGQEATDSATNDSTVATATGTSPDVHQSQSVPQQDDTLQQLENGRTEPAGSQPGTSAADRQEPAPESSQPKERVNGVDSVEAADSREDMLEQEAQKPVSAVQQGSPVVAAQHSMPGELSQADVADMGEDALWAVVQRLQTGLQAREKQLERQGQQLSDMHQVQQQLQTKNEELVTKAAKVSEEDMAAVQAECERRLGAAERKAYALAKERDALRRGSDKLSSAHDLLKEKDNIIAQVMEEGERLSKKQSSMEGTIKKLRQQIRDLEATQSQAASKLAGEESKLEAAVKARQQAEASLAASLQQHKAEADQQKQQYEALLARARSSQAQVAPAPVAPAPTAPAQIIPAAAAQAVAPEPVTNADSMVQAAAEESAAVSAKEGLEKRAREAESQAQALADTVEELRLTLDRQRASTELREQGLRGEVRDLEARCQAAEARHQDLAANIPEATRPLLRQLEAMQASAAANSQAWAAAEASLTARLNDAEGSAAAAGEREKRAWEKVQAANTRLAASAAALDALKTELADADSEMDKAQGQQRAAETRALRVEEELSQARQAQAASHDKQVQLEHSLAHQLAEEQAQSLAASEAAEERIQALEQRLASHAQATTAQASTGREPPAMAAPGYEWQLVRSSEKGLPARNLSSTSLASTAASDRGTDGLHSTMGHHSRPPAGSAGEAERLRTVLRQKEDQVASLQSQLTNLEATRDSLAEEVIAAAGLEESARAAEIDAASAREEAAAAEQQLLACTEMLGEKEERLEELKADLQDVKQLYKDQIEFMVEQLAHLTQQGYVSSPFRQVQEDRTMSQSQSPHGQDATAS